MHPIWGGTLSQEKPAVALDHDVYVLTPRGAREIRDSDTTLSMAQLDLLVRIDGVLTVAEIAAGTPGRTREAIIEGFEKLARQGHIRPAAKPEPDSLDFTNFFADRDHLEPGSGAMKRAGTQATAGVASLKRHGYFVRIARRAAVAKKPVDGRRLCAVVIEDEPSLSKLLKQYLFLEGIDGRVAANREQIVAALRERPVPDLVLLDVMLPDADGFDILHRMRLHPDFKSVPIIMLTAKATREAVLKGLAGGADAYLTKPFDMDVLEKALDTVLGRSGNRAR